MIRLLSQGRQFRLTFCRRQEILITPAVRRPRWDENFHVEEAADLDAFMSYEARPGLFSTGTDAIGIAGVLEFGGRRIERSPEFMAFIVITD
jgi:hypothetical protein